MGYDATQGLPVRLVGPPAHRDLVDDLVARVGLTAHGRAPVGLLLAVAGAVPGAADRWMAQSLPHLVLVLSSQAVRIGPFVCPGLTACLRCVAAGTGRPGVEDTGATPNDDLVDPALLTLALGWAARDLRAWSAGREPATWSTTYDLGSDPVPTPRRWLRHPHCGCSWFEAG